MFRRSLIALAFGVSPALVLAGANGGNEPAVALIDQARAEAGGVTPGDAPGFPVTLSQGGSYRLAGNLAIGDPNTTAIEVTADNVTLDLGGFAIVGATSCSGVPTHCFPVGSGDGVRFSPANRKAGLTVSNGTIRGMGGHGVTGHSASQGFVVERLRVMSNGGWGISLAGALVSDNMVLRNGQHGIMGHSLQVSRNTVLHNGGVGLFLVKSGYGGNTLVDNYGGGAQVSATNAYPTGGNFCNGVPC